MKKELRLQGEPDSFIETRKFEMEKRKNDVNGICQRIVVFAGDKHLEGRFEEMGGITRSWKIARDSYIIGLFDAAIIFSSIAVECAINNDERMKKAILQRPDKWLRLNRETLKEMKKQSLPIETILEENESLDDNILPLFVRNRNKVAHGDFGSFKMEYSRYFPNTGHLIRKKIIDISFQDALNQFQKCSSFLKSWVKQNPDLIHLEITRMPL